MKKTVRDVEVCGKRVLTRCDFNVPMENGEITNDTRIRAALPTIQYLIENGAKVILMSHLGRPKGEADPKYSLAPVARRLAELLEKKVVFAQSDVVVDDNVKDAVATMGNGDVTLLENTRFREEETHNAPNFTQELAQLGDLFVNDAFGTAHRAHCSTAGLAEYMPAVSGFLIEKELKFLGEAVEDPARPFVAIMGGAKVSDKILLVEQMMKKVDTIIIGGGMAYTFYKAMGLEIGKSILDEAGIELAARLMEQAKESGVNLLLPLDTVCADEFSNDAKTCTVDRDAIPADMMGMDIGPKSIEAFGKVIREAGTVVWNGPMGVFEMENFAEGTKQVAQAVADCPGVTVIGGGDSAAAVEQFGFADQMTHISTGGGASLEFLEGKKLPGVEVLEDK